MAKFFISYSRSVKDEVRKVVDLLIASRHEVWWDGDIPVMADWWATILEKIEWCEVFIFVASEKSVQSAYCLAELKYASDRQRPILPFMLEDPSSLTLPKELPSRGQWLVYDGDPAQMLSQINTACEKINWALHKDIKVRRPPEPSVDGISVARQFHLARRLASEKQFEDAKLAFTNIKHLDYAEWGAECDEWLGRLNNYTPIMELVDDESTAPRARTEWAIHSRRYGKEFDPHGIDQKLREMSAAKGRSPWLALLGVALAVVGIGAFAILSQLSQIPNSEVTPNPTTAIAQITAQTPDATLTLDAMVANILATNAAEETLTATAFTATPTATATPDLTLTANAQATEAAVIAAVLLATQRAQLTANAPTNTAEPTATFTLTPSFTSPPTITPTSTPDLASTAAAATQAHLAALATLDVQATQEAYALSTSQVEQTAAAQAPIATVQVSEIQLVRIISNTNANVRSGPGENFNVISVAAPNSTYTLLEERDGWYRISADGWVSSQIARVEQSTEVDWTPVERVFDGVPMVLVPAGCFMMGSETGSSNEKPVHEQCFDTPFWIRRAEVTNAQYAAFVAAGGYNERRYWTDAGWDWKTEKDVTAPKDYDNFTHGNQPRVGVSWYEAVAYTRWLTERLRASGAIGQDEEIRLPNEAEWEYAARGPANLTYPWGNDWDEMRLNAKGSQDGYGNVTAPVGSYPQGTSWVGALDMSGNVWEWTLSGYADYPYVSADGRNDVSGDTRRVLRGGSWSLSHFSARAAYRSYFNPDNRSYNLGFRLLLDYSQ